jgi:hypothetical protein
MFPAKIGDRQRSGKARRRDCNLDEAQIVHARYGPLDLHHRLLDSRCVSRLGTVVYATPANDSPNNAD